MKYTPGKIWCIYNLIVDSSATVDICYYLTTPPISTLCSDIGVCFKIVFPFPESVHLKSMAYNMSRCCPFLRHAPFYYPRSDDSSDSSPYVTRHSVKDGFSGFTTTHGILAIHKSKGRTISKYSLGLYTRLKPQYKNSRTKLLAFGCCNSHGM